MVGIVRMLAAAAAAGVLAVSGLTTTAIASAGPLPGTNGHGTGSSGSQKMGSATGASAATAAAVAAGDSLAGTAPGWPQLQGDARHAGFEPGETSVTPANVGHLSVAWTAPLPDTGGLDLAVTGGSVYAASGSTMTALNATTGAQLWQTSFPGTVISPAVRAGLVVTGYNEVIRHRHQAFITALNSATGSTVWTKRISGAALTQPVTIRYTRIYASLEISPFTTGQVLALGLAHGHQLWESPALAGCSLLSAPSVTSSFVVVGDGGGYVSALHASNGTLAWQDNLGAGCGGSNDNWVPAISGTTVYAGLLTGVAALNLASGAVVWNNASISQVFFPLSVTTSTVIAGANDGTEPVALDRSTGSVRWRSPFQPPVVVMEGLATFGSLTWASIEPTGDTYQVIAVNRYTGHKVYSSAVYGSAVFFAPPVVDAGHVYLSLPTGVQCLALTATTPPGGEPRPMPVR